MCHDSGRTPVSDLPSTFCPLPDMGRGCGPLGGLLHRGRCLPDGLQLPCQDGKGKPNRPECITIGTQPHREQWQGLGKALPNKCSPWGFVATGRYLLLHKSDHRDGKSPPDTRRTGFFFALRPCRRASSTRHSVRHSDKAFFEPQGKNKAHSSRFGVVIKQEIPRFTPYFQR